MRYRKTRTKTGQADRLLDQTMAAARESADAPETPLAFMKTRVEARLAEQTQESTIMANISRAISTNPKLSISLVALGVFILFSVLIPLPYSATVGYTVSLTAPADATEVSPDAFVAALGAVGIEQSSVNLSSDGETAHYTIYGLTSEGDARTTAATFKQLAGVDGDPQIVPITKRVSGTLAAQAVEKLFRVEVEIDGQTDAEIAAQIAEQVAAQGGTVKEVRVETTDDGQKNISIEIDSEQ